MTVRELAICALFGILFWLALFRPLWSPVAATPHAPSVNSTPHVVEEKLGDAERRVDDFDRKVTCWVFSTGVSCLPFNNTRAPESP